MDKEAKNNSSHSHFLRFISDQVLKNQSLDLPTVFVKENGESLSEHAYLTVPTGEVWKLKLKKVDDGACLDEGWLSFVENYSIKRFSVLLFRYKGRSHFSVLIFDTTATEIEYPVSEKTAPKFTQVKEEEVGEDQSLLPKHSTGITRKRGRADTFESPNFSFTITMQQSYISRSFPNIPVSPARSYFRVMGSNNIILKGEDGRSWCMKYNVKSSSHKVYFTSGWDKFSHENHLSKGDRCTFELVRNITPATFKVTINRAFDEYKAMDEVASDSAKRVPSTAMEKFLTSLKNQPFFTIRMTSCYVSQKCNVNVPWGHAGRYLNEDERGNNAIILHGSNGKAWDVGYSHYKDRRCGKKMVKIYKGWKVFSLENQLRAGETLVFQMIKGKPKEYNVTIFSI